MSDRTAYKCSRCRVELVGAKGGVKDYEILRCPYCGASETYAAVVSEAQQFVAAQLRARATGADPPSEDDYLFYVDLD